MQEAHQKVPMRLTGFCLMTNHFHLLLWPHEDGDLSRWMEWLMNLTRPSVSSALQKQRACLAVTLQGVSRSVGMPLSDCAALRGTKSAAGQYR